MRPLKKIKHFGFSSLIEIIIATAISVILAITGIFIINPIQLLSEQRDTIRIDDVKIINKIVDLYANLTDGNLGTSSTVYVSIPDTSATCSNLGLPQLPSGWSYSCKTSANYRKVDGTGWMPINFLALGSNPTFKTLPIDPRNTKEGYLYYTYTYSGNGDWEINTGLESKKYNLMGTNDKTSFDGGDAPELLETGNKLNLFPGGGITEFVIP